MPSAEFEPSPQSATTGGPPPAEEPTTAVPAAIARWVKTECGRAKYQRLAGHSVPLARLRLWWFVLIAALRDWRLPVPPEVPGQPGEL